MRRKTTPAVALSAPHSSSILPPPGRSQSHTLLSPATTSLPPSPQLGSAPLKQPTLFPALAGSSSAPPTLVAPASASKTTKGHQQSDGRHLTSSLANGGISLSALPSPSHAALLPPLVHGGGRRGSRSEGHRSDDDDDDDVAGLSHTANGVTSLLKAQHRTSGGGASPAAATRLPLPLGGAKGAPSNTKSRFLGSAAVGGGASPALTTVACSTLHGSDDGGSDSGSATGHRHHKASGKRQRRGKGGGGEGIGRSSTSLGGATHHRDKYTVDAVYARHAKWLEAQSDLAAAEKRKSRGTTPAPAPHSSSVGVSSRHHSHRNMASGNVNGHKRSGPPSPIVSRGNSMTPGLHPMPRHRHANTSSSSDGAASPSGGGGGDTWATTRQGQRRQRLTNAILDSANAADAFGSGTMRRGGGVGAGGGGGSSPSNRFAAIATGRTEQSVGANTSTDDDSDGYRGHALHTQRPHNGAGRATFILGGGRDGDGDGDTSIGGASSNQNQTYDYKGLGAAPDARRRQKQSFRHHNDDGSPRYRRTRSQRSDAVANLNTARGGAYSRTNSSVGGGGGGGGGVHPQPSSLSRSPSILATINREAIYPPESDFDFIKRFEERLKITADRNTEAEIALVIEKKGELELREQTLREEEAERKDARREQIYLEHQSIHERKHLAELGLRGTQFFPLVLVGLFLAKCRESLRLYHCFDVHRRLLAPIVLRRLKVGRLHAERAALTESRLEGNPPPTLQMLRSSGGNPKENFFASWGDRDVNLFISLLTPKSFVKGEVIMHMGDMDRVMYIVTNGTVEVQIKKRTSKDKRRNNIGAQCFPLPTPTYVGEFALLCREPRGATIVCSTDVDSWCIHRADFEKVLAQLTPSSVFQLDEVANNRRKSNMERFFPIREETVREVIGFSHMSDEHLARLVKVMRPHVLRKGTIYLAEDEYRPEILFLADGILEVSKPSDPASFPTRRFTKGFCYGVREVLFHQESSPFQVKVIESGAEVWLLSRADLSDVSGFFPGATNAAVATVKADYARRMVKAPKVPKYLSNDPFLRHVLPPAALQANVWAAHAQPIVYAHGDVLMREGAGATHMFFIARGTVEVRHGGNMAGSELASRDDELTADPELGGTYSGRASTCPNLANFFPQIIRILAPKAAAEIAAAAAAAAAEAQQQQLGHTTRTNSIISVGTAGGGQSTTAARFGQKGGGGGGLLQQQHSLRHTSAGNNPSEAVTSFGAGPTKRSTGRMLPTCPPESQLNPPQVMPPPTAGGGSVNTSRIEEPIAPTAAALAAAAAADGSQSAAEQQQLQRQAEVGFAVGAYEFAARRIHYASTVRCLSYCEVWRVDTAALLADMAAKGIPHAINALPCNEMLAAAWAKGGGGSQWEAAMGASMAALGAAAGEKDKEKDGVSTSNGINGNNATKAGGSGGGQAVALPKVSGATVAAGAGAGGRGGAAVLSHHSASPHLHHGGGAAASNAPPANVVTAQSLLVNVPPTSPPYVRAFRTELTAAANAAKASAARAAAAAAALSAASAHEGGAEGGYGFGYGLGTTKGGGAAGVSSRRPRGGNFINDAASVVSRFSISPSRAGGGFSSRGPSPSVGGNSVSVSSKSRSSSRR